MRTSAIIFILICLVTGQSCRQQPSATDDFLKLAVEKKSQLRLSTYITAQTVNQMFTNEPGRRELLSLLRCYGITKVYFEVYRGGLVISPELIKESVLFLHDNGFDVAGGIATVPGEGFGMSQDGPLEWFNWQNKKTQDDLRKVIEDSAPYFSTFIVDDFLCTSDTSMESKKAKGDRSWSEYRQSLLTGLAESVIIKPAKDKNPDINIIIKYPQWYDRFHLFGYDVVNESKLFDGIWVGTESRGQYTRRFGFVQPYEGFINFRWLSSLAGSKTGGAWFDHEDCTDQDFIDQAYQSVLAGAKELILFSFDSFINGNQGHHLLFRDFEQLADLAEAVADHPVTGVAGYKPPDSDAGGDLYLLDYIGMIGVSLIPESSYPAGAGVVFLPAQAAADTAILEKIVKSLDNGSKIVMTAGFIAKARDGDKIAKLAQINWPLQEVNYSAASVFSNGIDNKMEIPLILDYQIIPDGADVLLKFEDKINYPYLLRNQDKNIVVLNSHTFSRKDFDQAEELLLSPAQIGMLELPTEWINIVRSEFHTGNEPLTDAPSRVSFQQLSDSSFFINNYNQAAVPVTIILPANADYYDKFGAVSFTRNGNEVKLVMSPRSHIWFSRDNK